MPCLDKSFLDNCGKRSSNRAEEKVIGGNTVNFRPWMVYVQVDMFANGTGMLEGIKIMANY